MIGYMSSNISTEKQRMCWEVSGIDLSKISYSLRTVVKGHV